MASLGAAALAGALGWLAIASAANALTGWFTGWRPGSPGHRWLMVFQVVPSFGLLAAGALAGGSLGAAALFAATGAGLGALVAIPQPTTVPLVPLKRPDAWTLVEGALTKMREPSQVRFGAFELGGGGSVSVSEVLSERNMVARLPRTRPRPWVQALAKEIWHRAMTDPRVRTRWRRQAIGTLGLSAVAAVGAGFLVVLAL